MFVAEHTVDFQPPVYVNSGDLQVHTGPSVIIVVIVSCCILNSSALDLALFGFL